MTEFEKLCERQREIILKGPECIANALHEETDEEVEALLFVLKEYLDPLCKRRLPYEEDILRLLREYSASDAASYNVSEAKTLIEEYGTSE